MVSCLSPAEPPALEAAEAAAAPLLRLSAGMEKRKAGAGDVVPPSKRFGGWSAVPAGWLQELARAGAPAAEAPMAESGGGDAKRRVEFDAPASEAKRRGKEKGPRSKAKRKAADAEPTVVVDAEQEAPRLREARARLTEEMAARRALRPGMGRAMAWAQACRRATRHAGCRRYDGSQPALAWVKGVGVRARSTKPAQSLIEGIE